MLTTRGAGILVALSALVLAGPDRPQAQAPLAALEGSGLVLRGADGRAYLTIEQAADGNAALALRDRQGVARVELSLLDDATPRVLLRDGRGTERAKLLLMPEGSPMLLLKDGTGRTRTEALYVRGAPGFVVFDEAGRPGWRAPADEAPEEVPDP